MMIRMWIKKALTLILCMSLVMCSFAACGKKENTKDDTSKKKKKAKVSEEYEDEESDVEAISDASDIKYLARPSLGVDFDNELYDASLVPNVPDYSIDSSLSNVINAYWSSNWSDAYKQKLAENLFVVGDENGREFYETYEFNSYSQDPNFVTVDSMMHTYHLYFAYLLKSTEKTYLSDALKSLSQKMFNESLDQYDECEGTDWEDAAARNVAYFAVACSLIGENVDVPSYASDMVNTELGYVMEASSIEDSKLTGLREDYSQYKPRGYYETSEQLQKYFRTMMWYGRMTFTAENDDMTRSAILMTIALDDVGADEWNAIYGVTSFFAGASDDYGYCEYLPVLESAYDYVPDCEDLADDEESFDVFVSLIKQLAPPQIQSIPVYDDEENVIPGFRFMGQRFTIDANIMQNLIYRAVEANDSGEQRLLPTVLDVPAALGSDKAKEIALDMGANRFPTYSANMEKLRADMKDAPAGLWTASLYSQWLNTLTPLLNEKGAGYPKFMQSAEWTKKTLETFAGSYTELKHDTVLYAKQPMAEMGGGDMEELDDRGYVEPEPLVYARFASLAQATSKGLQNFGMISSDDVENLNLLTELANKLLVISQKELKNELPTDEEFELIRNYGGNIEHFWYVAMKAETDASPDDEYVYITSEEFPAALVVDVATDPNGTVLEAGTGNPREIAVVVPVEGTLRIAYGSVYNYYEFSWPMSDRLTDSKWRQMIGAEPGEGYTYERDSSIVNPDWTQSYRATRYDRDEWW